MGVMKNKIHDRQTVRNDLGAPVPVFPELERNAAILPPRPLSMLRSAPPTPTDRAKWAGRYSYIGGIVGAVRATQEEIRAAIGENINWQLRQRMLLYQSGRRTLLQAETVDPDAAESAEAMLDNAMQQMI